MNTILSAFNKGESSRTFDWSSICGLLQSGQLWILFLCDGFPCRCPAPAVLQCCSVPAVSLQAEWIDSDGVLLPRNQLGRRDVMRGEHWAARETIHRQTSLFLLSLTWKFRRWLLCLNDYNLIQHESLLRITNLPHQVTHFWWLVCVTKVCSLVQRTFCRQSDTSHVRDISTWHVTLACDGVISRPGPGRKRSGVLVELSVI